MSKLEPLHGIVLCVLIGIASLFLAQYIPIGSVTIAIILGFIIGNTAKPTEVFQKGISFSEKKILALAIALLGVNLDYKILAHLGFTTLIIIIVTMIGTIFTAVLLAKLFKFNPKLALLLGIGNAVCGSSAIAATEKIVGAEEEEVGLSVAIVNFLGTIGIFLLPVIAKFFLKFDDIKSGVMIGNTLQAVGQVIAAGFSVNDLTGHTATIVKMTRILMLTPLIFILIFSLPRRGNGETTNKAGKIQFPAFIIAFILLSLIPTLGLLSEKYIHLLSRASHYALLIAMAGIGLKITFKSILKNGKTALLIGALIFLVQIVMSSVLISVFL